MKTIKRQDVEEFVRAVLSKDLGQKRVTNTIVRNVAKKVAKTMPKAYGGRRRDTRNFVREGH